MGPQLIRQVEERICDIGLVQLGPEKAIRLDAPGQSQSPFRRKTESGHAKPNGVHSVRKAGVVFERDADESGDLLALGEGRAGIGELVNGDQTGVG